MKRFRGLFTRKVLPAPEPYAKGDHWDHVHVAHDSGGPPFPPTPPFRVRIK